MAAFFCPTCKQLRKITEAEDPRYDHCWVCGTTGVWSDEELERMEKGMYAVLPEERV